MLLLFVGHHHYSTRYVTSHGRSTTPAKETGIMSNNDNPSDCTTTSNHENSHETDAVILLGNSTATSRSSSRNNNNNNNRSKNLRNSKVGRGSGRRSGPNRWSIWAWALPLWIIWDLVLMHHLDKYNKDDNPSTSSGVFSVRRNTASASSSRVNKNHNTSWSSTNDHHHHHWKPQTQQQQEQQHGVTAAAEENTRRKERERLQALEENKARQMEEPVARITTLLQHQDPTVFQRPPLDSILDPDDNIIGDPGFLLDVAVIGFGKCGTSTVMDWIGTHPQVRVFPQEVWDLMDNRLPHFIRRLYDGLEPGPNFLHGYKAPQDITQDRILDLYRKYWPNAKLILGIRHPVRWFESFYNFRIQTVKLEALDKFPAPEQFIGRPLCSKDVPGSRRTCTSKGDFAYELFRLGKQNYPQPRLPSELEQSILQRYENDRRMNFTAIPYMENPVLLFETEQLSETNERSSQFRQDVSHFLELPEPILGEIPHTKPGSALQYSAAEQARRNQRKINICENTPAHTELREALMRLARDTSRWIRESGFLDVPTVFVPQREHFEERLLLWMEDPCDSVSQKDITQ